ncbi:MAG: ABC transporter substrate-binding protein [Solirubrobacterales bacterium]|jgi:putative ABC transport system substrate-binding protein
MSASRLVCVLALAVGLAAVPLATDAQQSGKVPRIGALVVASPGFAPVEGFRQGLRDLGYVEGRSIAVDYRYAEGNTDRHEYLAAEVVRLEPDVIVVWGTGLAQAVRRATPTIPIVLALGDRPVEMGLVADLARPGGNVTGFTTLSFELSAKRLELLKEVLPRLARVAVLYAPDPRVEPTLKELTVAAGTLGIRLQPLEARGPQDFDRAFAAMSRERAEALILLPTSLSPTHGARLADLALRRRLPTIVQGREVVAAGALMGYAASWTDISRRAAAFVDKILKGAKPADLPVEQPTKFELQINLKTAKTLGLTIPRSVLVRADELME